MIRIQSKNLSALILPYGATLAGLWCQETPNSLILGASAPSAYTSDLMYFGAVVGPIANRISDARVEINGQNWQMEANEGTTSLHSGSGGTHARHWEVTKQTNSTVELTLVLPHGAAGLPGKRTIVASYALTDDARILLTMEATSDQDTVMNLAHHPYWCLDPVGESATHHLQVDADAYLAVNAETLPTGDVTPVTGTNYDFRTRKLVPMDKTIDVNFCLADKPRKQPERAAVLDGSSGLRLEVDTTEPGLQVYNGSGLGAVGSQLHDRRSLEPFAGIALEPQHWPDAARHGHFPSISLRNGQKYAQKTIYTIR